MRSIRAITLLSDSTCCQLEVSPTLGTVLLADKHHWAQVLADKHHMRETVLHMMFIRKELCPAFLHVMP